MVIKGFITATPEPGDNHFQVRIPFIEDNTGLEIIMPALLCSQPGTYGGYNIGDCVFVSFEGDKHMDEDVITDTPVIIGKLYQDYIEEVHNNLVTESLTVSSNAKLPNSTKLGDYSLTEIFNLIQNVNVINNSLIDLEDKVEKIEQDADIDCDDVKSIREELNEFKSTVQVKFEKIGDELSNLPTDEDIQFLSGEVEDLKNSLLTLYNEVEIIRNNYVNKTTNQIIGGQKDFEVVPRILVSSKLPTGYTQLEYIIFNGTQGIDTGLTGTLTTAIKIQYCITDTEPNRFDIVIGSRASATSSNITIAQGSENSNNAVIDFGNYNNTRLTATEPSNTWLEAYTDKNYRYILNLLNGDSSATATSYGTSFTTPYNLFIGYMGNNYTTSHKNLIGQIKMCQIWENNVLVRDFIPCKNSENTVGMYDAVNGVFYPDMYGGTLGAGPESSGSHYAKILSSDDISPVTYDVFMRFLKTIPNYNNNVSQTLKHDINGSIQWVND